METCIKADLDYTSVYSGSFKKAFKRARLKVHFSAPLELSNECKCGILAHCQRGFLVEYFNISAPVDCLHQCHIDAEQNCHWVTYDMDNGACLLFQECSYGNFHFYFILSLLLRLQGDFHTFDTP